ncbi:hypothetical protein T440DRAFT_522029 [Plenodomus tracheiphilus IPT5]|uniref:BTB domain-containing protein n=1 Tax=Plenodomus tracheiphilus IPT5 TaxID=1408161 RepID=A0A6A7AVC5_9PLEO|nr:hypothetical protein T440DRAFT_522029 [Plenodomus tracheiphilus IPT5]
MADNSHKLLLSTVKELLISGNFSDLTVICGTDVYKVHEVIVCSPTDFFARAVKFGGTGTERNEVQLPDDEPAMIKLFMQYLYEGEYEPKLPGDPPSTVTVSPSILETRLAR